MLLSRAFSISPYDGCIYIHQCLYSSLLIQTISRRYFISTFCTHYFAPGSNVGRHGHPFSHGGTFVFIPHIHIYTLLERLFSLFFLPLRNATEDIGIPSSLKHHTLGEPIVIEQGAVQGVQDKVVMRNLQRPNLHAATELRARLTGQTECPPTLAWERARQAVL